MSLKLNTYVEQVSTHLREEIRRGRWRDFMPGVPLLKAELGVNHNTIDLALKQLENEGLLINQGAGKPRRIQHSSLKKPTLKIQILLYEPNGRKEMVMSEMRHRLESKGHVADFASKTLKELGMNVQRVADFVKKNHADAWLVVSGSHEILSWFVSENIQVFALFGRVGSLRIAGTGPTKTSAVLNAVRKLIGLGHKRIVMITRMERRKPHPGILERYFLDELKNQGIMTGSYNLPDWEETQSGFQRLLDSMFGRTPPTALLISEAYLYLAIQNYLSNRGIIAPRDISLIAMDKSPELDWFNPVVSHISYDDTIWYSRAIEWANNIAKGKTDQRLTVTSADFIEGGTIGPAPKILR